jgi:glycosyltransferase involved in cell wall biosynthesis
MSVLVSIAMPIYNRPIEMIKALDSILCQSYSNFELIISNDNSPNPEIDNIVRKYELLDSRIKYYKQNTSLRTVENYQFVLKKASGKYFMWLADDDWLDLYFVENCLNFLENNSDYSICVGNCIYQDNGVVISTNTSRSYTNDSKWVRTISYYHQVSLNGYMYGLIRKSCLDQIEFENEIGFDWEVVGSLFYQGKIKVLNTTAHYITKGGVSNDISSLINQFKKNNLISRNFIGLGSSINCSFYIFKSKVYKVNLIAKIILSLLVFIISYINLIGWDLLNLKRKVVKLLKINKNGVIFKVDKID